MKVSLIQGEIIWHKPELNVIHFESLLRQVKQTDLIILPEMWITGFTMQAHKYAQSAKIGLAKMEKWSQAFSATVMGSLLIEEAGSYYNRLYLVSNGRVEAQYDKKHLFGMAGEDRVYVPGAKRSIVEISEWQVCTNICYDLRFPVWTRNQGDYDVLTIVANWPVPRIEAWKTLLKARAIENQAYVIGVNCIGNDIYHNAYSGASMAIDPVGNIIDTIENETGVIEVELKKDLLNVIRTKLPFLKDRDPFKLL